VVPGSRSCAWPAPFGARATRPPARDSRAGKGHRGHTSFLVAFANRSDITNGRGPSPSASSSHPDLWGGARGDGARSRQRAGRPRHAGRRAQRADLWLPRASTALHRACPNADRQPDNLAAKNLRTLGPWAFPEPTESYRIDPDFDAKVARPFDVMIARASGGTIRIFRLTASPAKDQRVSAALAGCRPSGPHVPSDAPRGATAPKIIADPTISHPGGFQVAPKRGCRVASAGRETRPMEIHSPDIFTTPDRVAQLDRLGDEIAELSAHL